MPALQQLRYLIALSDTLNFSLAAEICRVAQPTLSMQIKQLEQKLGVQLVERSRSHVIITPLGKEVVHRARQIMGNVEDIRSLARQNAKAEHPSELKIGVVQTLGAYVLSLAIGKLKDTFAHTRLSVREDTTEGLLRHISDARFDVILLAEEISSPNLHSQKLIDEPMQLVLPSDHPLSTKPEICAADLRGQRLLSFGGKTALQDEIATLAYLNGAEIARDYEGTSLDTLRQMVALGMGIALLPALYVRSEVMREALVCARPLTSAPYRPIKMLWRKGAVDMAHYQALAAAFAESLAPWDIARNSDPTP